MTGRVTIDSDLNFVQGLIHHGGADLKKCYQCSTCTVACPLTPDEAPFPRKDGCVITATTVLIYVLVEQNPER